MKRIAFAFAAAALCPSPARAQQSMEEFTFKIPPPTAIPASAFPQPPMEALDLCSLTQRQGQACLYLCQNGASLTRPFARPGGCEPYFTRKIVKTGSDRAVSLNQLEDLLRDANPEVRKAAVRSAREQVMNLPIQDRVLEILRDKREREDIRVEAARTISYVVQNSRVQEALKGVLSRAGEPGALRIMAYKAFWGAAAGNYSVQDFLQDAAGGAEKDLWARRAAVWALFDASRNSVAQELLLSLVNDARQDESLRIEALKSLFSAAADYKVKPELLKWAAAVQQSKLLRLAAIKALSGIGYDNQARALCERLAREDKDYDVRAEAAIALEPDYAEVREFFHLAYREGNTPYGLFVNPIDRE